LSPPEEAAGDSEPEPWVHDASDYYEAEGHEYDPARDGTDGEGSLPHFSRRHRSR
jgi:hypothetical protein